MKPISRNTIVALAATLTLPACATIAMPDYPSEHPANPNAQAAPPLQPSKTLATYKPAGSVPNQPEDATPAGTQGGHADHTRPAPSGESGDMNMENMEMENMKNKGGGHDQH